jgi:hypothetical protein
MSTFFLILFVIFLVGTAATLFTGIGSMTKSGPFNDKYGNKLMQLRVLLQGGAIVCLVLYLATR